MSKQCMRLAVAVAGAAAALACSGGGGSSSSQPSPFQDTRYQAVPCGVLWEVQYRIGDRLEAAAPGALFLADYPLTAEGTIVSPLNNACTDAVARGLEALCEPCMLEPRRCEDMVRTLFAAPPAVCSVCGDGVCLDGEDGTNCQRDCAPRCGDGTCASGEFALSCPMDCAEPCGDGRCALGETPETCPEDCRWSAGDGLCEPGESPEISPEDCLNVACGDRFCQEWETRLLCPGDCCGAPQCSGEATFCLSANAVGRCDATGDLGCPIAVVAESCALGCTGDTEAGRCRTCTDVVIANPGMVQCSTEDAAYCGNGSRSVITCGEVPGSPGCFARVDTPCPGPEPVCSNGACVECVDGACTPGERRCGPETGGVEVCQSWYTGCEYWAVERSCAAGTACLSDGLNYNCRSCCSTEGARYCDAGTSVMECGDVGAACPMYRGAEVCEGGQRCDVDDSGACSDCCEVGQVVCEADGELSRRRVCSELGSPGCGRWSTDGTCDPGFECNPDPAGTPCLRRE